MSKRCRQVTLLGGVMFVLLVAVPQAGQLDPKALTYTLPADVEWVPNESGSAERAVLYGDESQPGPYAFFIKWKSGNFSQPHSHPNHRYIIVVSGTWWVGTGADFDTDSTVPMPPGAFVVHTANEVHYDGAKEGDAVMLIHGMGPATSRPAE